MQISQAPSPKIRLNSLSMLPASFPMIVVILKLGQTEQLTRQVKQLTWRHYQSADDQARNGRQNLISDKCISNGQYKSSH